jgi:transposase
MPRLLLSDEHWSKLRKTLLHKAIYNKRDLRMIVEGMLYRMRTGCPWRDLPKAFGNWNKVYKRFNAWSASGKWLKVFKVLVVEPDLEWIFLDGSYAKAHQHNAGAASGRDEAIGKSRAGNTSKIHLAVDAHGLPIEFEITGGQTNACTQAPALITKRPAAVTIVADKGYDSENIRELVEQQGVKAVIPRKRNPVKGNADLDIGLYRNR